MPSRARPLSLSAAILIAGLSAPAFAAGPTYVVTGDGETNQSWRNVHHVSPDRHQVKYQRIGSPNRTTVEVVKRGVAEPAAVVSRELREQPTFPDLIEVRIGSQTVFLDPRQNYQNKPFAGELDDNTSLLQARRLADIPLPRTYVIHGKGYKRDEPSTSEVPEPSVVIPVPERFKNREAEPKRLGPTPDIDPPDFDKEPSVRKMAQADQ